MQRIRHNYQFNLIKDAIGLLPVKVKPYLETVDFVFDYTPGYIGAHYDKGTDKLGRSYYNTCHCCFRHHTTDKQTTIFLFSKGINGYKTVLDVIWHEIAHALWERLEFVDLEWIPITDYEINIGFAETFACSFTRWLYPDNKKDIWKGNQELQRKYDKRPIEFFNNLLKGLS